MYDGASCPRGTIFKKIAELLLFLKSILTPLLCIRKAKEPEARTGTDICKPRVIAALLTVLGATRLSVYG